MKNNANSKGENFTIGKTSSEDLINAELRTSDPTRNVLELFEEPTSKALGKGKDENEANQMRSSDSELTGVVGDPQQEITEKYENITKMILNPRRHEGKRDISEAANKADVVYILYLSEEDV